jgi:hypothetical protein
VERVEQVFKMRLGGAEFADIAEYAAAPEQNWQVSVRQLWRYIAAADALVKERFNARADHLLNRHILQRRQLYAHAMAAGDYSTALRVLDSEAKLENLFPVEKKELTGQAGTAIVLHLVEEVVGRPAPILEHIVEEVVVTNGNGRGHTNGQNGSPPSGPAGLPPQQCHLPRLRGGDRQWQDVGRQL